MKVSTVSAYKKDFFSIIEIENKMCQICYKCKTLIELVPDKLIMSLDGLNSSNSPSKIDHPKYKTLATDTITIDGIFQNYFKESLFEDVTCENCHSVSSETKKIIFTVCRNFKEPLSVLNILLQRGMYDVTNGQATTKERKISILLEF